MNNIFEFVKADNKKAILKVKELTTLDIAEHPYLNSKMDYITITRGKQHTMTVINKDGSTWSVNWGDRSCTMCTDSVNELKWAARDFFQKDCGILLDLTCSNDEIEAATVFYNGNLKAWQLTLRAGGYGQEQHIWFRDCGSASDVMLAAMKYIGKHDWHYQKSETGIDTWVAEFELDGPNKCETCSYGRLVRNGWYCDRHGTYYHQNGCVHCEYWKGR